MREVSERLYLKHTQQGTFEEQYVEEGDTAKQLFANVDELVERIRKALATELASLDGEQRIDVSLNIQVFD